MPFFCNYCTAGQIVTIFQVLLLLDSNGGGGVIVWTNSMSAMMPSNLASLVATGVRTSTGLKRVHLNNCAKVLNERFKGFE